MFTTGAREKPPQDVVAIFHAAFHPTLGNVIDWSLKASEDLDITNIESNCLPSGAHSIEKDVIYFAKGEHQGVCVFRRRPTPENGHRGFRLSSLGILLAKSARPRPWRHVPSLKQLIDAIYASLDTRKNRQPTERDWDPARTFFEERKVRRADLGGAGDWGGWSNELAGDNLLILEANPTLHLSHMLRILGPSALTVYKHILGRRRVLVFTAPPVEAACVLCQVAADMCFEAQYEPTSHHSPDPTYSPGSSTSSDQRRELFKRLKTKSKQGIKVLGMVTLDDIDRLKEESRTGRGWVACTTDRIILEKPSLYDLVVDLTTVASPGKVRPAMYVLKQVEQPGSRNPQHKLAPVRSTWSDVQLWAEINRLMMMGSGNSDSSCCEPAMPEFYSRVPIEPEAWSDMWRVYEDVCVVCANVWLNLWHGSVPPASILDSSDFQPDDSGAIRLEGEDHLRARSEPDHTYMQNVGMGIEGRPSVDSLTPLLDHNTEQHPPYSSGISFGTWHDGGVASTSAQPVSASVSTSTSDDAAVVTSPLSEGSVRSSAESIAHRIINHRERRVMITLSILHAFHKNTVSLLQRLASFLPSSEGVSGLDSPSKVILTPRDVKSFKLGPLSNSDLRFVEWLMEEYGGGVRLDYRRKWRDLVVAIILGLVYFASFAVAIISIFRVFAADVPATNTSSGATL